MSKHALSMRILVSKGNKPTSQLRLAQGADAGVDIYNCYHLLTQMAGLYMAATEGDEHQGSDLLWRAMADACLKDLGEVYSLWKDATVLGRRATDAASLKRFDLKVRQTCLRCSVLVNRMNVWVDAGRWARLLMIFERRWSNLTVGFAEIYPLLAERFAALHTISQERLTKLQRLMDAYAEENKAKDASYTAAGQILAKGGLLAG